MTGAYVGLQRHEMPHASTVTRIAQQLGGSFGTAVLAVIVTNAAVGAADRGQLAQAFGTAFWWATAFTVLAAMVSLLLPQRPAGSR